MMLIFILHALWAASVTTSEIILRFTKPVFLTGVRMTIAGVVLLAYQYWYAHEHFVFKRKHFWLFAQIAFFGIFVTYNLRHWALDEVSAAKAMFLYNSAPFMSSLYSYFAFSERLSKQKWLGLLIGCIGMIPILMTRNLGEGVEIFSISRYELAILASAAAHSYSWIIMRKLVRDKSYSPMMVNGVCMLTGGIAAFFGSFLWEGFTPVAPGNLLYFVGLLAFVIIISNIICHNLYGYLLRQYTATFLSFTGFMGPPLAALYGWILFSRPITWHYYVSTVVMFVGLYLFYKEELQTDSSAVEPESL